MVANSESRENFSIQDTQRAAAKPAIDPSQFWREGNQVKLTLQNTAPEALYMSSPYGKDVDFTNHALDDHTPINDRAVRDLVSPNDTLAPKDFADTRDAFKPRPLFDQRDMFMAASDKSEHVDPREDGDSRDKEALRDAIQNGNIEDLKKLVADMSPEKLKRLAEQLSSADFEVEVSKDGKLTVFDTQLGLGISVDNKGNAEVVKKDAHGNYIKDAGVDPKRLLHKLGSDFPKMVWETQSETIVGQNVYDVQNPPRRPASNQASTN